MSSRYPSTEPTFDELVERPRLALGHDCDLRIDTGKVRYWTIRDADPTNKLVIVEHLVAGRWITMRNYNGGPR